MRVLVIGAGILGASTAFHLAVAGAEVEVIDAGHEGKATRAGAGIVCPWATVQSDPEWYGLYAAGARYYPSLVEQLKAVGESDIGYGQVGALVVADEVSVLDEAMRRIMTRARTAPEAGAVRRVSPIEARALFPPLAEGVEAIHIPGAARVDARLLADAMIRAAAAHGATYRTGRVELRLANGRAQALNDQGAVIPADEIVVTGGAWASQILSGVALEHPVIPQKGQIVHLGLPGVDTSAWPVVLPIGDHYLVAFDDSRVVIGATREDRSGYDLRPTAGGLHEVLTAGLRIAPGLANATHIETRVGLRPAAPTVRPLLGRVRDIDGLTIGNGLGSSGLTIGPVAGRQLALVASHQATDTPIDAFGEPQKIRE